MADPGDVRVGVRYIDAREEWQRQSITEVIPLCIIVRKGLG